MVDDANAYLFVHRTALGMVDVPKGMDLMASLPAGNLYVCGDDDYRELFSEGNATLFRFGHPFASGKEAPPNRMVDGFSTLIEFGSNDQYVTVISDRAGLKPVFYCADKCVFSNNLSVLADAVGVSAINSGALEFSLVYGFFPSGHTVYDGIRRLEGGAARILANGELVSIDAIPVAAKEPTEELRNECDYINGLHDIIFGACKDNVPLDQDKVAVLLGGFDSALVASVLVRLGFKVKTFSFFFEEQQFNQRNVDTLIRGLGIEHEWVKVDSSVLMEGFSGYRKNFFQPTNWPNYVIQSLHLVRVIKQQGFKVCFTGDGCDGLFQGYPGVFKSARVYRRASTLLGTTGRILLNMINRDWLEENTGHVYRLAARVLRNSGLKDPERTYLMYRIFDETSLARLFSDDLAELEARVRSLVSEVCSTIPAMSVAKLAYAGRSNMGPNRLKLNVCGDVTGIKMYSPYLDSALKKFVADIPENMLRPKEVRQDIGKYILTKMAADFSLLPREVIYQPKMAGVYAPVDKWYFDELAVDVRRCMRNFPLKMNARYSDSLLKDNFVQGIYRKCVSSDSITTHAVSLLYTTSLFFCDEA